ncbi:MAG: TVP38/TMEM64 family protein [Anaerolineales bacterium]
MINRRSLFLALLLVLVALAVIWIQREPLLALLSFLGDRQALIAYINSYGLLGPIVLALLQALQILISVVPGDLFYFSAGYVYGLPMGFVLNLSMTTGAGLLAFQIARRWGRPVVDRLAPARVVDRWDATARHHGFVFFLLSNMLPVFPTDTMNYVAGLSPIPWPRYALASLLGRAPMVFLYTLLGAYGTNVASLALSPVTWGIVALVVGALYVLWLTIFRQLVAEVMSPKPTHGA